MATIDFDDIPLAFYPDDEPAINQPRTRTLPPNAPAEAVLDDRLGEEVEREYLRQKARGIVTDAIKGESAVREADAMDFSIGYTDAEEFIFGEMANIRPIWGTAECTAWAMGEACMIAAPQGLGKSTIMQQVMRARLGFQDEVLGMSVAKTSSKILYLAMDRPAQIARSMRRMMNGLTADQRKELKERLVIWRGPLPAGIIIRPQVLLEMAQHFGCDTIFGDSVKDMIPKLNDDEAGLAFNTAVQYCVRAGVDIMTTHHTKKGDKDGSNLKSVDDIYGSTWITAGHGSLFALNGKTGDLAVKFVQLKMINNEIGPFEILHDHEHGVTTIAGGFDMLVALRQSRSGLTVAAAAGAMFAKPSPDRNEQAKARRNLDRLVNAGLATLVPGRSGGANGGEAAIYLASGNFEIPDHSNEPVVSVVGYDKMNAFMHPANDGYMGF